MSDELEDVWCYTLDEPVLRHALTRASEGEDVDMILAELFANAPDTTDDEDDDDAGP